MRLNPESACEDGAAADASPSSSYLRKIFIVVLRSYGTLRETYGEDLRRSAERERHPTRSTSSSAGALR
jgi:hypothetical protein